jgi:dipeptidyl aminopeptidase/acylaminoacyl peptidase
VRSDAPPFFVIHGTHDALAFVEDARHFVAELRRVSRSPVLYAEIPGAQHAFEIFHSIRSAHTVDAVCWFVEHVYASYLIRRDGSTAALEHDGASAPRSVTAVGS